MVEQYNDFVPVIRPAVGEGPSVRLDPAVQDAMDLLVGVDRCTVLVNDPQRHTDTAGVLRILTRRFSPARLRVIVATGTHQISPAQRSHFEKSLAMNTVHWHDCRDPALVPIGTWSGERWLLEEGGLLAIGSVEPHYFAGFTGAHKTATIGVASFGDIESNHAWAVHPSSQPCRTDGNPVYERVLQMLADLEAQRPLAAINIVQAGQTTLLAAGGRALSSFQLAARFARDVFVHQIDAPVDALIADVAGPLGQSFYQAEKGIKNNEWAVRDGGCLILAAPCPDRIGQDHFVQLLRQAPDYAQAVALVNDRGYRLGDHKAVRLRYLTDPQHRGVKVFVVSPGLTDEDASLLGLLKAASVPDAMKAAGIDPQRHNVLRVQDAGNTCVVVRQTA